MNFEKVWDKGILKAGQETLAKCLKLAPLKSLYILFHRFI